MVPQLNMAEDRTGKSFWQRKEGTTGMLFIAGALAVLFFALPPLNIIMSGLVTLLSNTIYATVLGVALFALIYVITNKRVQTLVKYFFKSSMRWITQWFVEIDPIGIMRNYVDDMKDKQGIIAGTKDKLRGQINVLRQKIQANTTGYEKAMALTKVANEKGNVAAVRVQGRQAMRLETVNKETYGPLLQQMEAHHRLAEKIYEVIGVHIEDLTNEVEVQSDRRKMILASHTVMKAAKAILQGGTTERELFDQALEFVVEDYGMKLGEIESFMDASKPFVDGLDLQNGVYEAEALKRLQDWEHKADSVLLGNQKQALLAQDLSASTLGQGLGVPAVGTVDYAQLLTKK